MNKINGIPFFYVNPIIFDSKTVAGYYVFLSFTEQCVKIKINNMPKSKKKTRTRTQSGF